jgi:hypothetical protein
MQRTDTLPWYRQFWPWFIISLPAAAVVACMVTIWLAVTNPDAIVRAALPDGKAWQPQSEVRSAYAGAEAADTASSTRPPAVVGAGGAGTEGS